jgi:DNA mismatch repair protein MutS
MQDPKSTKGLVERAIVRVVTPGTLTEDSLLDDRRPNHLLAVTDDGHFVVSFFGTGFVTGYEP